MFALNQAPIVKRIAWPDEPATQAFAQALAGRSEIADALIELHGDLGAGKTTFARHLLAALGVHGRVKSPTYAVVEPYALDNGLNIWHLIFIALMTRVNGKKQAFGIFLPVLDSNWSSGPTRRAGIYRKPIWYWPLTF